jgi:hypothetical protein
VHERVLGHVRGRARRAAVHEREPVDRVLVAPVERHEGRLVALLHAGEEGVFGLGSWGGIGMEWSLPLLPPGPRKGSRNGSPYFAASAAFGVALIRVGWRRVAREAGAMQAS